MAGAPHKQGLDYHASFVDKFQQREIQELIEAYGADGFLFWEQLQAAIYTHSHYLLWDNISRRQFRQMYERREEEINKYLPFLFEKGLLNKKIFNEYNVLTSDEIQSKYIMSTKGRTKVVFYQEYTIIDWNRFRFLDQIIHMYDLSGELLERFVKKGNVKLDPETKVPLKAAKKQKEPIPKPIKPSESAQKPIQNLPHHTHKQVNEAIRITYNDQDEIFKDTYTEEEYNSYVQLNHKINNNYPGIRKSEHQLTFIDYIEFTVETIPKPTDKEMEAAFKLMAQQKVTKDTDIYVTLDRCLQKIREDQSPDYDEPVDVYVPDKDFQLSVLGFWDYEQVRNHKQFVLMDEFCRVMSKQGLLDDFKYQFPFYKKLKELKGIGYRHGFEKFLGKQSELFNDGEWRKENWEKLLAAEEKGNKKQAPSLAKTSVDSHDDFMKKFTGGN